MAVSHEWGSSCGSEMLTTASTDVRYVGSHIQRRLFARRQINQQSTFKRRSAYSEAGTEVKSEKLDREDDDQQTVVDSAGPVSGGPMPTKRKGWFKFSK